MKAYILPDLVNWYLSEGLGSNFTEILEAIAKERGYKEGDGKRTESKQNKPRRRLQPLNLEPSASISAETC